MYKKIQMLRGLEKDLPYLSAGEIGFTVDTKKTFIGDGNLNVELAKDSAVKANVASITATNVEVAKKANKTDLTTSLALKRDTTYKLIQSDLSETLQSQILTNTIALNTVPSDKSVTPVKTDFLTSFTTNLFDVSKAVTTGYINSSNGTITPDAAGYLTSDFIEVSSGNTYATNSNAPSGYYNSQKVFVQGIAYNATKPYTVPTGLDIKYIRISFFGDSVKATASLFLGATLLPYVPYDNTFKLSENIKMTNQNFTATKFVDVQNASFIVQTGEINIFNKNTFIDNKYPNLNTMATDTEWASTDFMLVEEGKVYTRNGGNNIIVVYDINKINILQVQTATVTIPVGGKYAKAAIHKPSISIDSFMFVKGTVFPTTYVPYKEINILSGIKLPEPSIPLSSYWEGKKADGLGDSITAMDVWQPIVKTKLGFSDFVNHGVSGSRISGAVADSMWQDVRINALSADSDLYTVMGGTNDWASNTPMESGNKLDTNTFKGAFRVLLEKLIAKFPTKHVAVITTPYGKVPNREGWTDQTGIVNNNGFSTKDYAKACREIALEYGIFVIDVDAESYINKINILQFMADETSMIVHPNTNGAKRIAEVVVGKLRQIDVT